MVFRCLILLLYLVTPSITRAEVVDNNTQVLSGDELIQQLRDTGTLGIFDSPTESVFRATCSSVRCSSDSIASKLSTFCEVVVSSEICQAVDEEDLINCDNYQESVEFDFIDFFAGCTTGLFDSVIGLAKFVWDIIKMLANVPSVLSRTPELIEEGVEYVESARLYLVNEYDKAYDEARPPNRWVKAAKAVAGKIAGQLFKSIGDFLTDQYRQFGCLNFQARTEAVCRVAGEIIIPPAAAVALLRNGIRAVRITDNLRTFLSGQRNAIRLANRRRLGQNSLSREISSDQADALERAHLVGSEAVGRDGTPARVGNYTLAQLREKAQILRDAGFSQDEIRMLMEDGVVGISEGGFARLFRLGRGRVQAERPNNTDNQTPNLSGNAILIGRSPNPDRNILSDRAVEPDPSAPPSVARNADQASLNRAVEHSEDLVGQQVYVPRTHGGMSRAVVDRVNPDGTSDVRWWSEGQVYAKTVRTSRLRDVGQDAVVMTPEQRALDNYASSIRQQQTPPTPRNQTATNQGTGDQERVHYLQRGGDGNIVIRRPGRDRRVQQDREVRPAPGNQVEVRPPQRGRSQGARPGEDISPRSRSRAVEHSEDLVGQQVYVPRTAGGRSRAVVDRVNPDGTSDVRWWSEGQAYRKTVRTSRLRDVGSDAVRMTSDQRALNDYAHSLRQQPSPPARNQATRNQATANHVRGSSPQRRYENVGSVNRRSDVAGRRQHSNVGASNVSSMPSVVRQRGLAPIQSVVVEGFDNVKVGKFFQDSGGRVFVILEVTVNGRTSNRVFYRSNSQSVFRQLPALNRGIRLPGYDKSPLGEHALTAPSELNAVLSNRLRATRGTQMDVINPADLEGIIPVNRTIEEWAEYSRASTTTQGIRVDEVVQVERRPLSDNVGRNLARPQDVVIREPGLRPNYQSPVRTYDIESPVYGPTRAYVYKSIDSSMEYTVLRDANNRVWFGDVGYHRSSLTSSGLRTQAIDAEELVTPLWEYGQQIPEGFIGGQHPSHRSYHSAWRYIREMPEIRRWYRENRVRMPSD